MLEGEAGKEVAGCAGLGVVAGDFEDDEVEGVGFGGIDEVEKFFSGGHLRQTGFVGREGELAREVGDAVEPELRHWEQGYWTGARGVKGNPLHYRENGGSSTKIRRTRRPTKKNYLDGARAPTGPRSLTSPVRRLKR